MFGEPVPPARLAAARDQIDRADCVIAIGTSATVRPASGLLWIAESQGATIIEVNPGETRLTSVSDIVIRAKAAEALPALHDEVRQAAPRM
jgi:NAD-dependent deacetylase